jgi:hypothetical protein
MLLILAIWEVAIRRIAVEGQSGQKFIKSTFQPIAGHSGVCLSSQLHRNRRILVQIGPGIKQDPISKIIKAKKRVGGIAQVEETLSNKHKVLSSNSSTSKKYTYLFLVSY